MNAWFPTIPSQTDLIKSIFADMAESSIVERGLEHLFRLY